MEPKEADGTDEREIECHRDDDTDERLVEALTGYDFACPSYQQA